MHPFEFILLMQQNNRLTSSQTNSMSRNITRSTTVLFTEAEVLSTSLCTEMTLWMISLMKSRASVGFGLRAQSNFPVYMDGSMTATIGSHFNSM